jgi:hypothetical protein
MRRSAGTWKNGRKRWYVNSTAAGSNNGTSWTNAWTSFASISWGSIGAGDILYISGGTTSRTYNALLTIGSSGTAGKPITITGAVDSGHNGTVIIDGQSTRLCIDTNAKNHIVIQNLDLRNGATDCIWVNAATAGVVIQNNTLLAAGAHTGATNTALWVNCRGMEVTNCTGTNCAIIRNNTVTTQADTIDQLDCIYCSGSNGVVFDGNTLLQSNVNGWGHSDCIQLYNNTNITISNNWCEQTNAAGDGNNHGMWLSDTVTGGTYLVYNNVVVTRNLTSAITHFNEGGWTGKALIYNNTIYHRSWGVSIESSSAATEIKNNIIYQTAGFAYVFQSWSPTSASQINYNCVFATSGSINDVNTSWASWQGTGRDANGVNSNPVFVTTGTDFHLQTSSPAKNAGVTLSQVTSDRDGKLRPNGAAYDIGAYEF